MKTSKDPAEILALWDGGLSERERKALLAALNEDDGLRRALAAQLAFEDLLRLASADLATEDAHHSDEVLSAFVQGQLAEDEAQQVRTHLRACRECFVRMARLQRALKERVHAHSAAVPEGLLHKAKRLVALPAQDEVAAENFWQRAVTSAKALAAALAQHFTASITRWQERWQRNPKLIFIPACAAVALAVLFMLLLLKPGVENFAGDRLIILDNGPLGFTAHSEVREYEGMGVREDGENLVFQWPAIPAAAGYEVWLIAGESAEKRPLYNKAEGLNFTVPKHEVELNVKYAWELRGKLKDGRTFVARAEFVRRR